MSAPETTREADCEIPLQGGRTTTGVVRVRNTVRRPTGSHSNLVHQVLSHLRANGFSQAPQFLGLDRKQREILSFIQGEVCSELGHFSDDQLVRSARLIRKFHDATVGFPGLKTDQIICHHDLSPCNFVFENGNPIALIDFDSARPGLRIEDLAYAVWLWLNLGSDAYNPYEQGQRISIFLKAYSFQNNENILKAIQANQKLRIAQSKAVKGREAFVQWVENCLEWVRLNENEISTGMMKI